MARVVSVSTANGVEDAVRLAMRRAGSDGLPTGTLFVKPNYAVAFPRPGVTTDARVLEAVLGTLRDHAARVLVGEADGGLASFRSDEALRNHGLEDICKRTGAEMVDLSDVTPITVEEEVLGRRVSVRLSPKIFGKVDASVTVPVMKTHIVTTVSLGLKNVWGCDADGYRYRRRQYLGHRLALIARKLSFKFSLIDATTALDGRGPIEGQPVRLDRVIAGDDVVATDAACLLMMGIPVRRVPHIGVAAREGVGELDPVIDHDAPLPLHPFDVQRGLREHLIRASFHIPHVTRAIFDSPVTPLVYKVFGRQQKPRYPREWSTR